MKRVPENDSKTISTASKTREKSLRFRNKRKCKRKKNARTLKRFSTVKSLGTVPAQGTSSVHRLKHTQNVWIRTYQRMVKWHGEHQTNYWKHCAQRLKVENDRLKRQMLVQPGPGARVVEDDGSDYDEDCSDEDDPFDDTEDESADERHAIEGCGERRRRRQQRQRIRTVSAECGNGQQEDPEFDEEFLAFMEVSARHRLEHRRLKNESVH